MNLKLAELLITFFTLLVSYSILITIIGAFKAWVASKVGDKNLVEQGYLSLNPLAHFDVSNAVGFFCLFVLQVGWIRSLPINGDAIQNPYRYLKIVCAMLSEIVAYLLIAIISLSFLFTLFDQKILYLVAQMILYPSFSFLSLAQLYPDHSSLVISIGYILASMVWVSVVMIVLNTIFTISSSVVNAVVYRMNGAGALLHYSSIITPLILMFFFSVTLRVVTLNAIMTASNFIVGSLQLL